MRKVDIYGAYELQVVVSGKSAQMTSFEYHYDPRAEPGAGNYENQGSFQVSPAQGDIVRNAQPAVHVIVEGELAPGRHHLLLQAWESEGGEIPIIKPLLVQTRSGPEAVL